MAPTGLPRLHYPCSTPGISQWFMMTVIPLQDHDGAVVAHME